MSQLRENMPPLPRRIQSLQVDDRGYPVKTRDLYWAAGFLEGEGSFTNHSSLMVAASQTSLEPLENLVKLFGGKISTNGRQKAGHKTCFSWYLYGHYAAGVMMTLYCLMSNRRQDQIKAALAKWETAKVAPAMRSTCPKGHPYKKTNSGRRVCLQCQNASTRNSRLQRKGETQ